MIYANIILTVKPEFVDEVGEVRTLLAKQRELSLEEPGCERFEVYHSQSDHRVFILCERWASQEALDSHRKARAYQEIYQPQVLPRVDRVPHVSDLIE